MPTHAIAICGLPGSGKTTFLAALWHLVTATDELSTALRFKNIIGDNTYLNSIVRKWRNAEPQAHTLFGSRQVVRMNLLSATSDEITISFPDLSGETFSRLWENRDCDKHLHQILSESSGILLFIHADNIVRPQWILDVATLSRQLGIQQASTEEKIWDPQLAPTQVKLVDILQLFCSPSLQISARKLVIMLSAWDKVSEEKLTPDAFLQQHLPLLYQYLLSASGKWDYRTYGISAQGGDYQAQADFLCEKDIPSERIQLVCDDHDTHDITEPLLWLMEA